MNPVRNNQPQGRFRRVSAGMFSNGVKKIFINLVLFAFVLALFFAWQFPESADPGWGLNFSITHAQYLGFDWKKMYLDMLDDLKPKRLRVMALWEVVEPEREKYNFADIDYILTEAEKRGVKVIITLGHKQPGWPECHHPAWYERMTDYQREEALLDLAAQSVSHWKDFPAVSAWQVENEPFFVFGPDCPAISKALLKREIAVVKAIDPGRPVMLTDSGEKSFWLPTALAGADIFGSTMYRKIYHHKRQKYVQYFVPPLWYQIKGGMLKSLLGIDRFIGVELQAEPWFESDVFTTPWDRQKSLVNADILNEYADFARRTGFAENYFWGVEWWYYAKHTKGDDELWQTAKKILSE